MSRADISKLQNFIADLETAAYNAVEFTAKDIEKTAKAKAPVRKVYEEGKKRPRAMSKEEKAEVISIFRRLQFRSPAERQKAIQMVRNTGRIATPSRKQTSGAAMKSRQSFTAGGPPIRGRSLQTKKQVYTFQDYYKLSRQGRYELKRGIRDYTPQGGSSVIRVDIDAGAERIVQGRGEYPVLEPRVSGGYSTIGAQPVPTAQEPGRTEQYNVGKARGFGISYKYQLGGRLRRDIEAMEPISTGKTVSVSVVSKAPYSRYVEFPTSRTAAQPFLRPALKQHRRRLKELMKREIRG